MFLIDRPRRFARLRADLAPDQSAWCRRRTGELWSAPPWWRDPPAPSPAALRARRPEHPQLDLALARPRAAAPGRDQRRLPSSL